MSDSMPVSTPAARTRTVSSRVLQLATWIPRVLLAVVFVGAGLAKLAGDPAMLQLFDAIGIGQWLRYVVGLCEVAGAIGVLVPRLAGLAAIGLAALMVGATVTNVQLGASPWLPVLLLVVALVVVALRRHHLNPLVGPDRARQARTSA